MQDNPQDTLLELARRRRTERLLGPAPQDPPPSEAGANPHQALQFLRSYVARQDPQRFLDDLEGASAEFWALVESLPSSSRPFAAPMIRAWQSKADSVLTLKPTAEETRAADRLAGENVLQGMVRHNVDFAAHAAGGVVGLVLPLTNALGITGDATSEDLSRGFGHAASKIFGTPTPAEMDAILTLGQRQEAARGAGLKVATEEQAEAAQTAKRQVEGVDILGAKFSAADAGRLAGMLLGTKGIGSARAAVPGLPALGPISGGAVDFGLYESLSRQDIGAFPEGAAFGAASGVAGEVIGSVGARMLGAKVANPAAAGALAGTLGAKAPPGVVPRLARESTALPRTYASLSAGEAAAGTAADFLGRERQDFHIFDPNRALVAGLFGIQKPARLTNLRGKKIERTSADVLGMAAKLRLDLGTGKLGADAIKKRASALFGSRAAGIEDDLVSLVQKPSLLDEQMQLHPERGDVLALQGELARRGAADAAISTGGFAGKMAQKAWNASSEPLADAVLREATAAGHGKLGQEIHKRARTAESSAREIEGRIKSTEGYRDLMHTMSAAPPEFAPSSSRLGQTKLIAPVVAAGRKVAEALKQAKPFIPGTKEHEARRTASSLQDMRVVGSSENGTWSRSMFHDLIELMPHRGEKGTSPEKLEQLAAQRAVVIKDELTVRFGRPPSAEEMRWVDGAREHVLDPMSRLVQKVGVKITDPVTREHWTWQHQPNRATLPKVLTPSDAMAILRGPKTQTRKLMIEAAANMSGVSVRKMERVLDQMRQDLQQSTEATQRLANAEFVQRYRLPSVITPNGKPPIHIMEMNPAAWVQRYIGHYTGRLGFIHAFGQDLPAIPAKQKVTTELREETVETETGPVTQTRPVKVVEDIPGAPAQRSQGTELASVWKAGGMDPERLAQLYRALHRMPAFLPERWAGKWLNDPSHPAFRFFRQTKDVLGVLKSLQLTASAVVNTPEIYIGKATTKFGFQRAMKALGEQIRKGDDSTLLALGSVSQDIPNYTTTRGKGYRTGSFARIFRNASGRIAMHQYMNELQERIAARTALGRVQAWQAGSAKGKDAAREAQMLESLYKFPRQVAQRMVAGEGSPRDYRIFVQKTPPLITGSNRLPSETSIVALQPWFKTLFAFQTYGQTVMNTLGRSIERVQRAAPGERTAAWAGLAKELGLNTSQTLAGYALRAFVYGGIPGFLGLVEDWGEEPQGVLVDALAQGYLYGQFAAIAKGAGAEGGELEAAVSYTWPGSLITDFVNFFGERANYANSSVPDRVALWARRRIPGFRAARGLSTTFGLDSTLAILGLGEPDQEREAALSAYWTWRRENDPPPDVRSEPSEFHRHMRAAVSAMRNGRDPKDFVRKAFGVAERDLTSVRLSLRRRKTIATVRADLIDDLRASIGERRFEALEKWDAIIEWWAQSFGTAGAHVGRGPSEEELEQSRRIEQMRALRRRESRARSQALMEAMQRSSESGR